MIEMKLFLPENPTMTSQAKGINYTTRTIYTKEQIINQKRTYEIEIKKEMIRQGIKPPRFKGTVRLKILFGIRTKDKRKMWRYKTTKSDCDNLAKTFTDVLGDMDFFETGDQQIAELIVSKIWSDKPCVYFKIEEVEDDLFRIQR